MTGQTFDAYLREHVFLPVGAAKQAPPPPKP